MGGVQLYVKVELGGDSVGWGGEVLVYGSGVVDAYMGVLNDVVVPATVGGKNIEGVEDIVALTNELEKLLFTGGLCGIVTGAMGGDWRWPFGTPWASNWEGPCRICWEAGLGPGYQCMPAFPPATLTWTR